MKERHSALVIYLLRKTVKRSLSATGSRSDAVIHAWWPARLQVVDLGKLDSASPMPAHLGDIGSLKIDALTH
jgi:hypothetical protein